MVEIVLGDAELAFNPLSPVKFVVDRIETNPPFATITRPANATILIALKLDMEGRGGMLQILLPYATIEAACNVVRLMQRSAPLRRRNIGAAGRPAFD